MKRFISLSISALFAVGAWAEEPLSGEYVDLGLSVKWATCNLGATSSTDAGWYLAWGETSPKTNYTWATYLSDLDGTMTSWQDAGTDKDPLKDYIYGGSHSEGIGATAYDAATAALGAGYRMPTQTEFAELANTDNCKWVWYAKGNTEFNGVAGYKVTSKKTGYTGNSIFLPAAGYRDGERLYDEGSYGYYWSSTPLSGYADDAFTLDFISDDVDPYSFSSRYLGVPVRPVYAAPIAQIGETIYTDVDEFIDAFSAIDGEATVKLLDDITLSRNQNFYNTKSGADITLDLNGHSIKGNSDYSGIFCASITITGEGTIENTGTGGTPIGNFPESKLVVDGGSYIAGILCFVSESSELSIKGGKFKVNSLYVVYEDYIKPIIMGGIFSIDPTECVAEGYETVANDDEATKAEYPYKVVEKSSTPTAIESINADKAGKVTKTIENGKVVIIRNGERYDIAGRKL